MKLSEVRPCDSCGGKIAPTFYVVRLSLAMFTRATDETLGLARHLGGSLALAEVMSPDPEAVLISGDKNPKLQTELFLCMDCCLQPKCLAELVDRREATTETPR